MKTVSLRTSKRNETIDITREVRDFIREEKIVDGCVVIFVPHTTAAVTINEAADPDVQADILDTLSRLIPASSAYRHVEGNSDSHVKASLIGASQTVLVEKSALVLGTWQGIFFCEFDGPRARKVILKKI
jgi:secondary thiamine-phosphate synthase enzyme